MAEAHEEEDMGELMCKVMDILAAHTIGFQHNVERLDTQGSTQDIMQDLLWAKREWMDAQVAIMATQAEIQAAVMGMLQSHDDQLAVLVDTEHHGCPSK